MRESWVSDSWKQAIEQVKEAGAWRASHGGTGQETSEDRVSRGSR